MKNLARFLKGYIPECILAPLFKLLEASFELIVPLIMAKIIDVGIGNADTAYIIRMGLILVALAAVGLAAASAAQFFAAKAAIGFSTALRSSLLNKIQTLSYSDLDSKGVSALITRMTSDVDQAQNGVNQVLRLLLRSPFVVFGAMIVAFTIDVKSALIFPAVIAVLCIVVFAIIFITLPMHTSVQHGLDDVTAKTRENLNGVRVLRAFTYEAREEAEFERRNARLAKLQLKVGRISALLNPITLFIVNIAIICLIRTGALRVNIGALTQGEVVALYNLMSQILIELIKMANLIITMTRSTACAKRCASIFDIESSRLSGTLMPAPDAPKGSVEFHDVSFTFADGSAPAIEGISFSAAPGETIGIIGGTGSGKSALINLIPGFYHATEGKVVVDGIDVKQFDSAALNARIGVVPQKAVLFEGSIRSNLLMGNPNADEGLLRESLKTAQALEIVANKPHGLDEKVEQGGRNFSGGQKQRLTIARALVKQPEILILDDSASALDYATDAELRMAIGQMKHRPTTFIVSQRAASVRYADKIIVMDDGHIVGFGRHEELIKSCSVYSEIYFSQFKDDGGAA